MTLPNLPRQVRISPLNGEVAEGRLENGKMRSIYEWRNILRGIEAAKAKAIGPGVEITQQHYENVAGLIAEMEALIPPQRYC